ncbi:MAG: hypothetical protein FWE22_04735 [Firmicutes bacterium]|nr:hypothetical protein [Bacillota bacterium]
MSCGCNRCREEIFIRGCPGPRGPRGPIGPRGCTGERGPRGPMGCMGERGPRGHIGCTGPRGERGPIGPIGCTGPRGPMGCTGPRGERGFTGSMGPMGPIGLTGPVGPIGATGAAGATGAMGPRGDRGARGERGERGERGRRGPQGERGEDGRNGSVTIPFASHTPLILSTDCDGGAFLPGFVGFGSCAQGTQGLGSTIELLGSNTSLAFIVPENGEIEKLAVGFTVDTALTLHNTEIAVHGMLYKAHPGASTFHKLTETLVSIPPFTGNVPHGEYHFAMHDDIDIQVEAGSRLLLVVYATVDERRHGHDGHGGDRRRPHRCETLHTITGYVSGGLTIR